MKRKTILLVSFLLTLYIVPSIFISSYAGVAIPAQQNTSKEFSISADWYSSSWLYRKSVNINGLAGAGTDYAVLINVTYSGKMQSDFDDVRFTDNDNVTLLDHWRETYIASTYALFWVEVKDDLGTNQVIYMYYGNPTASDASNGTATFLVYEDWSTESIRSDIWDIVTATGSISYSAVGATHGTIAKVEANAGVVYKIITDYDACSPIAVRFRSNIEKASTGNTARQGYGYDGAFSFALVQTAATVGENFYVYDDAANQDSQAMDSAYFDAWVTFEIQRTEGVIEDKAFLYADNVLIETASIDPDEIATNPAASIMVTDSEDDLYSDWVIVRKMTDGASEPAFSSFGDEEGGQWQEAGEATIYFRVPFDYWAFDMTLIFLGLIMVIVSFLYAAYKIQSDPDMNTLIVVLLLFMFGFALFFGGIGFVGGG